MAPSDPFLECRSQTADLAGLHPPNSAFIVDRDSLLEPNQKRPVTFGFWLLALTVLAGAGIYGYLRAMHHRTEEIPDNEDTGAVLVAFSSAYPDRPVREIRHTEGRTSAFLRIADGTVGLVQVTPHHTSASLLEPGGLLVDAADNDRTIHLHFLKAEPTKALLRLQPWPRLQKSRSGFVEISCHSAGPTSRSRL